MLTIEGLVSKGFQKGQSLNPEHESLKCHVGPVSWALHVTADCSSGRTASDWNSLRCQSLKGQNLKLYVQHTRILHCMVKQFVMQTELINWTIRSFETNETQLQTEQITGTRWRTQQQQKAVTRFMFKNGRLKSTALVRNSNKA